MPLPITSPLCTKTQPTGVSSEVIASSAMSMALRMKPSWYARFGIGAKTAGVAIVGFGSEESVSSWRFDIVMESGFKSAYIVIGKAGLRDEIVVGCLLKSFHFVGRWQVTHGKQASFTRWTKQVQSILRANTAGTSACCTAEVEKLRSTSHVEKQSSINRFSFVFTFSRPFH